MKKKDYIRNIYSKYWISAREKKYGVKNFDKNICRFICDSAEKNTKMLDVACGTGYPFGSYFDEKGFDVSGIDIAPSLIESCQDKYPNIKCKVGDAEHIEYPDNTFGIVYCFHSSWYFDDLIGVINEMIRVSTENGFVIFNALNCYNKYAISNYNKEIKMNRGFGRFVKILKNLGKLILRKGTVDWHFVPVTSLAKVNDIYECLRRNQKVKSFKVLTVDLKNETLKTEDSLGHFENYPGLVFVIKT